MWAFHFPPTWWKDSACSPREVEESLFRTQHTRNVPKCGSPKTVPLLYAQLFQNFHRNATNNLTISWSWNPITRMQSDQSSKIQTHLPNYRIFTWSSTPSMNPNVPTSEIPTICMSHKHNFRILLMYIHHQNGTRSVYWNLNSESTFELYLFELVNCCPHELWIAWCSFSSSLWTTSLSWFFEILLTQENSPLLPCIPQRPVVHEMSGIWDIHPWHHTNSSRHWNRGSEIRH